MATQSAEYLSSLHKTIDSYFGLDEVNTLCFYLGVDFDNLRGETKQARIRELIVTLARDGRLQSLVDRLRQERANVRWQDVPADFVLPTSIAQEDIRQVIQYTVYGDMVQGDKIGGDKISVGSISNSEGLAIGSGASAIVQQSGSQRGAATQSDEAAGVQQAIDQLNQYLQMVPAEQKQVADELAATVAIIVSAATAVPVDRLHVKLLVLGQKQLASELAGSIPGIEQVVNRFVTAVTALT